MDSWSTKIISVDGSSWGLDSYDGTYHVAADGIERDFPLGEIFESSIKNLLGLFEDNKSTISFAKSSSGMFTLNLSNIGQSQLFNNATIQSLQLNVDSKTYQPSSFNLSLLEGTSTQITLSATLVGQAVAPAINPPAQVNPFGDFLSRESVVIATGNEEHDYLWNRWEQANFSCTECVDENATSSNSGLDNQMAFLFNTNPLKAMSGSLTENDLQALESGTNPVSGQPVPPAYAAITNAFISTSGFSAPGQPSAKNTLGFPGRVSGTQFPLVVSKTATDLKFQYVTTLPATDYITFFINNNFFYKVVLNGTTTPQNVSIPIDQFAGKTVSFAMLMNPYGPLDSTVPTGTFTFTPQNIIINASTPKTPFYVK